MKEEDSERRKQCKLLVQYIADVNRGDDPKYFEEDGRSPYSAVRTPRRTHR